MQERKQEEFDLFYLLRALKKTLRQMFSSIGWLFTFSLRKWNVIVLFILAGALAGYLLYKYRKNYVVAAMTVSHARLENDYCEEIVNSLAGAIDEVRNEELAVRLGVSRSVAADVRFLQFKPFFEKPPRRYHDSVLSKLPFRVEIAVYRNNILDTLQDAILRFLEESEFASKRKLADKIAIENVINKIDAQIIESDSLKTIVNSALFPRGNATGLIWGEPINPVSIYARELDIYEKRTNLKRRLELNNSFEILINFALVKNTARTRKIVYPAAGAFAGYILAVAWLLSRPRRKTEASA